MKETHKRRVKDEQNLKLTSFDKMNKYEEASQFFMSI